MSKLANDEIPTELLSILDVFNEPASLLSTDYRILATNQAYRRTYADGQPFKNRFCYEVSHRYTLPCDQVGENCPLKNAVASNTPQRVLHLHHTPNGEEHVDVEMAPILDKAGNVRFLLERMRISRLASPLPKAGGLVGRAASFNKVLELVERVATSNSTVLLLGESGTGKELIAQAVHEASVRRNGPFVPVDCTGLTETLFESELFGHEKGSFTGAHTRKFGLVEAAHGGTLFLDEIGEIPLAQQVKLLRLLESSTFRRVGGVEPQKAEFRLVCATHRDLRAMVEAGSFRRDLYYRINAFPIHIPALRERLEDLSLLAESMLQRVGGERQLSLDKAVMTCLRNYSFPGNIRELRNILERASLLCDGEEIKPEHLPEECCGGNEVGALRPAFYDEVIPLEEVEQRYLLWALASFQGDKRALAKQLGLSERTLYRKLSTVR
ncbi:MAG: sigma 54-interacting transcriptional regulator [Thiohalomonadaceae bacterium]